MRLETFASSIQQLQNPNNLEKLVVYRTSLTFSHFVERVLVSMGLNAHCNNCLVYIELLGCFIIAKQQYYITQNCIK